MATQAFKLSKCGKLLLSLLVPSSSSVSAAFSLFPQLHDERFLDALQQNKTKNKTKQDKIKLTKIN